MRYNLNFLFYLKQKTFLNIITTYYKNIQNDIKEKENNKNTNVIYNNSNIYIKHLHTKTRNILTNDIYNIIKLKYINDIKNINNDFIDYNLFFNVWF